MSSLFALSLSFPKRPFKITTRLQLSHRKLIQIQDKAYEPYTRFGHTFKILPVSYQLPLQRTGSIDISVPDVLKTSFPGHPNTLQFDVVADLSLILPAVQERSQGSWGESDPAAQQPGSLQVSSGSCLQTWLWNTVLVFKNEEPLGEVNDWV